MSIFSSWFDGKNQRAVIFGHNAAVADSEESIAGQSALVAHPSAATALEVASSDAADASGGTGAKTIRIYGLDTSYAYQTADVTMNGQTAVAVATEFLHVYGAEVLTVGTGGKNAGIISVADDSVTWSSGAPSAYTASYAHIAIGDQISRNGWFMVPASKTYKVRRIWVSNTTQIVKVRMYIREGATGLVKSMLPDWPLAAGQSEVFAFDKNEIVLPEKSLLEFRAVAATTGAVTSVHALLERVD